MFAMVHGNKLFAITDNIRFFACKLFCIKISDEKPISRPVHAVDVGVAVL